MSKILGTRVHEANAAESDRSRAGPLKASRIRHAGLAGMYAKHTRQECAQARNEPLTEQKTDGVRKRTAFRSRKEVFQPHLPVRLPCYDLAPITSFALGRPSR